MRVYTFDYASRYSFAKGKNVCLSRDAWAKAEPTHKHDYYELCFIYHGNGIHVINGISYPIDDSALILFSKSDSHSFYSLDEFSMINCCFVSRKNLNFFPIDNSTSIISLTNDTKIEVESIIKTIEIELQQKGSNYEYAVQNCIDLLLLILNRSSENKIARDPIWSDLLAFISENYAHVNFQDAINITNMSKSNFCRKFKEHFSVSFLTYVNQIRIQQAQRLLTSTNLTLPEISEQVGYGSNLCRFHEDFKKFTNTTPHKYKTTVLNNLSSEEII